jgi:hypothetical protein
VPGLSQAVAEDRTALREIVSGLPS